jgi:hypothetical protein
MQRPGCYDQYAHGHTPEGTPERRDAVNSDANRDEIAAPENGYKNGEGDAPRGEWFDGSGGGAQGTIVARSATPTMRRSPLTKLALCHSLIELRRPVAGNAQ